MTVFVKQTSKLFTGIRILLFSLLLISYIESSNLSYVDYDETLNTSLELESDLVGLDQELLELEEEISGQNLELDEPVPILDLEPDDESIPPPLEPPICSASQGSDIPTCNSGVFDAILDTYPVDDNQPISVLNSIITQGILEICFPNSLLESASQSTESISTSNEYQRLFIEGTNIIHGYSLSINFLAATNELPTAANDLCRDLNRWTSSITNVSMRNEVAMHLLYWTTEMRIGRFYLSYDSTSGQFSYKDSRIEFNERTWTNIDSTVDSVRAAQQTLINNIRTTAQSAATGNLTAKRELANHLLSFIALVESQCPSIKYDMPGWAGNYIGDFFDRQGLSYHINQQFNCVWEAKITARILRRLQNQNILPSSFTVLPEEDAHGNLDLEGEDHVGVMLRIPGNGQIIIDTWMSPPGQRGHAFETMAEWLSTFRDFTRTERRQEQDLQTSFRLPNRSNTRL